MIIYDAETLKPAKTSYEEQIPFIDYAEGFEDFEGMGVSVICTLDTETGLPGVWLKDSFPAFSDYMRGKIIGGFNNIRFDNALLNANGIEISGGYDLLREIWILLGLNPDKFSPLSHGGYSLQKLCESNLKGWGKTMDGVLAPVEWQRGNLGKVINYCMRDVLLTSMLFQRADEKLLGTHKKVDNSCFRKQDCNGAYVSECNQFRAKIFQNLYRPIDYIADFRRAAEKIDSAFQKVEDITAFSPFDD